MTVGISQGGIADCEAVLVVLQAAFTEMKGKIEPESGVWKETAVSLQQKLQTHTLFIAKEQGQIIGCVFCEPQEDKIYLGRLAVLPSQRGRGIASQLIEQVEQFGREQGCTHCWLGVRIVLAGNVRLFQKHGYVIVVEQAHQGFDKPTYYLMVKPIS